MIKMTEYAKRRKELMRQIGPNGIAIIPSAGEILRNGDAHFAFRQQADFYYLTGFNEPEAVLVIAPKRKEGEYILFNRVRNRDLEIWDGPRAGQDGAVETFLADQSFPIYELPDLLPEMLKGRGTVYYPVGQNALFEETLMQAVNTIRRKARGGIASPNTFVDIGSLVHEMRVIKSDAEVALMQKAIDISTKAHTRAMEVCQPGMFEYQLEAELMYEFIRHGARFAAYNSIVGAGRNTCVLHYVNNNAKIADGDLVLIDAGCEYENYASDITRTFPANGKFTGEQKAIYELVLASQLAAIKAIKPGALWTSAQTTIIKVLTQGLVDLKILKGNVDDLIEKRAFAPFYMHNSGHWLGLDVHDAGSYAADGKWRKLEKGMVLTVEPGLYISADIPGVHERWHNIGVRIEDNILVTSAGRDVLSQAIPKSISDIEALMAK